uniref:Rad21/Rec8-like protein C-terminal eukaryotic domain-containing protein n=1 Tax=Tetranychus urticae TaxID=32264 RepID=T1JR18_TETUR
MCRRLFVSFHLFFFKFLIFLLFSGICVFFIGFLSKVNCILMIILYVIITISSLSDQDKTKNRKKCELDQPTKHHIISVISTIQASPSKVRIDRIADEQYEERMRNKRTNVLLRFISKQLADGNVTFGRLVSHDRRKQVAQKFFSLLVLKKQQAVELTQDISVPYGEILITKGYRYDEALSACAM